MNPSDSIDEILASPAGAAGVLAVEFAARSDLTPIGDGSASGSPGDRDAAVIEWVDQASVSHLKFLLVSGASVIAGRWNYSFPLLAQALKITELRRAVAEGVIRRLGPELAAPLRLDAQYVWLNDTMPGPEIGAAATPRVDWCTAPSSGLFTATGDHPHVAAAQVQSWDYMTESLTCWRVEASETVRTLEIRSSADWVALLTEYPSERTRRPNSSWEIPGPNAENVSALLGPNGHVAARNEMSAFVEPDWSVLRRDVDAVHLTWRGFLTCEGRVAELPRGRIGMLRGWGSERTLWLNPVLAASGPVDCAGLRFFDECTECAYPRPGDPRYENDATHLRLKGVPLTPPHGSDGDDRGRGG